MKAGFGASLVVAFRGLRPVPNPYPISMDRQCMEGCLRHGGMLWLEIMAYIPLDCPLTPPYSPIPFKGSSQTWQIMFLRCFLYVFEMKGVITLDTQ